MHSPDGSQLALAMAPDGHTVLSAGGRDETIAIHDLAAGTVRTIARRCSVESAIHGAHRHTSVGWRVVTQRLPGAMRTATRVYLRDMWPRSR
jgi:hypothetical protein